MISQRDWLELAKGPEVANTLIDSLSPWERVGERALVSKAVRATSLFPGPSPRRRRETNNTLTVTLRLQKASFGC
jgi:hypothetical protein